MPRVRKTKQHPTKRALYEQLQHKLNDLRNLSIQTKRNEAKWNDFIHVYRTHLLGERERERRKKL